MSSQPHEASRADQAALFVAAAFALLACALMLQAAGQPIFTDDLWWHLGLGRAFWDHGLDLREDPLLFAAAAPPSTAAWLFEVPLHGVVQKLGLQGLRVLHGVWVAVLLAVWGGLLWRESRSSAATSVGMVAFIGFAAYRLVQFRPHLFTVLAALALYALLVRRDGPPSWLRVGLAALLAALWANVHAAFPLALLLPAAALGGVGLATLLGWGEGGRTYGVRLAVALALIALATCLNPEGPGAYRAYFIAGSETPDLLAVGDEWRPFGWLHWPSPTLPPSLLAWGLGWATLFATAWATWSAVSTARRTRSDASAFALVALAWTGLALISLATRFLWMGAFPLLLIAREFGAAISEHDPEEERDALGAGIPVLAAIAAAALVMAFVRVGDWPTITRGLPTTWQDYALPYPTSKYYASPIWFLDDAELVGNLYTDYFQGGFAGYWLAPELRTLVNGSLNVSPEVMEALPFIQERRGQREGESFSALLDRMGVDVFLGIRLPETGNPHRPWAATTAHLEHTPGWVCVYRNASSAVYLRAGSASRVNLERVARYYAERGIPFDAGLGFSAMAAIENASKWSLEQGLVPRGWGALEQLADERPVAHRRVATFYALLGEYEHAIAMDRRLLERAPRTTGASRRLVWSLLRLRRFDEAIEAAAPLEAQPASDSLSHHIAETARRAPTLPADERDALIANLPFLHRAELPALSTGLSPAPVR